MKRIKWFLLLMIFILVTGCATVPVNEEEVPVNVELMQEFYANLDVAQWLAWYDYIAWVSSDFITQLEDEKFQLLGEEWFVYQTDDGPRAAFGKYHPDSDVFETVYHLKVNGLDDIVLLDSEVESELGSQLARALYSSKQFCNAQVPELPVALNRYVRVLENGDIEVWYLPGGLPDGTLLYGMEFCFTLLADAQTLKSEHVLNRGLLGVNPAEFPEGETAYIGNGSYEIPSIGEIFFVTMFGKYFDSIYIESANYLSARVVVEGESAWIHADLNELTESGS